MTWRPALIVILALTAATPAGAQAELTNRAQADMTNGAQADVSAEEMPGCRMPSSLLTPKTPLRRLEAALAKDDVSILALGSGATVGQTGTGAGAALSYQVPGASFPYRMLEVLRASRKATQFHLTVKGGRDMTAETMGGLLSGELAANHYDLILWQTATVEAVRGARPDSMRGVLQDGAQAAEQANADMVLIDPQFSRFLRANTDLTPYETVLWQTAAMPGVVLFPRYELTRNWVDSGQVDLERVNRDQRDRTVALLNDCLGHALARFLLVGASQP